MRYRIQLHRALFVLAAAVAAATGASVMCIRIYDAHNLFFHRAMDQLPILSLALWGTLTPWLKRRRNWKSIWANGNKRPRDRTPFKALESSLSLGCFRSPCTFFTRFLLSFPCYSICLLWLYLIYIGCLIEQLNTAQSFDPPPVTLSFANVSLYITSRNGDWEYYKRLVDVTNCTTERDALRSAWQTVRSASEIASVALSAEQQRHTENVFHMLLIGSFGLRVFSSYGWHRNLQQCVSRRSIGVFFILFIRNIGSRKIYYKPRKNVEYFLARILLVGDRYLSHLESSESPKFRDTRSRSANTVV